jgi:hypothetical protein
MCADNADRQPPRFTGSTVCTLNVCLRDTHAKNQRAFAIAKSTKAPAGFLNIELERVALQPLRQ